MRIIVILSYCETILSLRVIITAFVSISISSQKTLKSIRRLMNYLDQQYNSTQYPIIVTENGISSKGNGTDEDPELNDHWRADFYHGYIGQLHRAVTEDKVNVFGYTGT